MQDLPEKTALLEAVARFLGDERLKQEVRDPAIAFRLRIAKHVIETVAREIGHEDLHDAQELERLRALFGREAAPPGDRAAQRAELRALNAELARTLRDGQLSSEFFREARGHVKQTLIEKLAVTQPKFDLSPEIE